MASAATTEMNDALYDLMINEPHMQGCFQRLMNSVLCNEITIEEGKKSLAAPLKQVLCPHYRTFLRHCMQQCYVCGFAAFYIRKPDGIPLPFALPLGSFTWSVETNQPHAKRRKFEFGNSVLRYKIDIIAGPVTESEVHVMNYREPVLYRAQETYMQSPICHILQKFHRLKRTFDIVSECNRWNAQKHVAITESVDLKDQTTSGIQLLDEVRRYTLTGAHGNGPTGLLKMRTRNNESLPTVNDGRLAWLKDQFESKNGGQDACFHMLPANMNVQELSTIEAGRELQLLIDDYMTSVYAFFDIPRLSELGGGSNITSSEQMSRNQYLHVLATCQFMENVATAAYCASFKTDPLHVTVKLSPQTRLEIHSAADIKALADAEVLGPNDKSLLKKLFASTSGRN